MTCIIDIPSNYFELTTVNYPQGGQDCSKIKGIVATIFLNFISLGIYNTYVFYFKNKALQRQQANFNQMGQLAIQFDSNYTQLSVDLNALYGKKYTIGEVNELENKRLYLYKNIEFNPKKIILSIHAIAITLFKNWLLNIATLGIAGIIQQKYSDKAFQRLSNESKAFIMDFKAKLLTQANVLEKKIEFLQQSTRTEEQLASLSTTDKAVTRMHFEKAKQHLLKLTQEFSTENLQNKNHEVHLRVISNKVEELKGTCRRMQEQYIASKESFDRLNAEESAMNVELDLLHSRLSSIRSIKDRIKRLNEEHAQGPKAEILTILRNLGFPIQQHISYPVPSMSDRYITRAISSLSSFMSSFISGYDSTLSSAVNGPELLQLSFQKSFKQLQKMGKHGVVFNANHLIFLDGAYDENLKAFYNYMALQIIDQSNCKTKDSKTFLKLNKNNVIMGYSEPEVIARRDTNGLHQKTIFNHIDDFTPLNNDYLEQGLDPVSAKIYLKSLNKEERIYLFNLLIAGLIPDESEDLVKTQLYISRFGDTSRGKILRETARMIKQVASAFSKRYDNYFMDLWRSYSDYEWEDKDQLTVKPLLKERATNFNVPPIKLWRINHSCFSFDLNGSRLLAVLQEAKKNYSAVFSAMTKDHLIKPLEQPFIVHKLGTENGRMGLSEQYWTSHYYLATHGCLMSNLLALFVCKENEISNETIATFKKAIASYLDKEEVYDFYKERILATHGRYQNNTEEPSEAIYGLAVDQYKKWLRGEAGGFQLANVELGELEIALAAEVVGIRIGVFRKGMATKLDANGLVVPPLPMHYLGPNTKETLYIWNDADASYYGLFPKLNRDQFNPLSEEIIKATTFWSKCRQ